VVSMTSCPHDGSWWFPHRNGCNFTAVL